MQSVILAAGESSRFWPLNQQHKSQIKILGKPLVFWTIKSIAQKGIKDIILIASPHNIASLKEELTPAVKELAVNISFLVQEKPLGTGNAIFQAKDLIKGPFFVFWPYKIIAGGIIEEVLKRYQDENLQIALIGTKTTNPPDYGMLRLEGEKVMEILENPKPGEEPSDIKTTGAYFLQPEFFNYYQKLPERREEDFIDALNLYVKEKTAKIIIWEKDLPSLKYPWETFGMMRLMFDSSEFKNYTASSVTIGENTVIDGQVYIDENVTIGPNSVIFGPCYIGENCKIGANNVLRGPVNLEKGVVTGAFTEIKNCLIEENTHIHSGYFGDSIIGKNCRFGAGFIVANRRIDRANIKSTVKGNKTDTGLTYFGAAIGENTRFGIKTGTMPGVLIGSDCVIGPGTLVFENIENNTNFYTEFKGIKKKNI